MILAKNEREGEGERGDWSHWKFSFDSWQSEDTQIHFQSFYHF